MKKISALILTAVTMLQVRTMHAEELPLPGTAINLTPRFLGDTRWSWWYGKTDKPPVTSWIEFYKDGTARVPWTPQLQQWSFTPPSKLAINKVGPKTSNYVFIISSDKKSGVQEGGGLRIRYDKELKRE